MDSKAGPSKSKIKQTFFTSRTKNKRRHRDDLDSEGSGEYIDEDIYSQGAHEEFSSSSEGTGSDNDLSIFNVRQKTKTTCPPKKTSLRPRADDTPSQPSRSSASKRGLSESNHSPIIQCKRLKPMNRDGPTTRLKKPGTCVTSAQSSNLPSTSSASKPALRQLELDGNGIFEFKYEFDCRATSPSIVQDCGDLLPDIPERHDASLSALPEPMFKCSTPSNLPDDDDDVHLPDYSPHKSPHNSPSRDGATNTWSSNPTSMKIINFTKKQELLVPPPTDPYEAFRLLIDDELLDLIVRETNANALRVGSAENVKRKSRIKNWKELTKEELLTFLGLLLHTGTIRLNRISDYWKRHYLFNISCFAKFMSRNRFLLILRCLHFTSETSEEDRLIKIRALMDHFNNRMNTIYCPGKELSLDESMVLWRGRLLFRKYIKNKRQKYGIKLYVLAEPDGTVLKCQVYAGANDETSGAGHAGKIVLKLLEERLDCGHHVYMDNDYNSYGLAVELLDRQTYCTGTLRKNLKENPIDIETISLKKGENKSLFLNGVHIGKWRDKQHVLYISTEHGDEMMETISKKGSVVMKPVAIIHYNNFMSAIDLQDQILDYYPVQRKTLLWYKKLFVHMLQMSLSNAFYLYNKFSAFDKMNLYDFRLNILETLLPDPNEVNRRNVLKVKHELTKIEKTRTRLKKVGSVVKETTEVARKECKGCKAQKKRVQTIYECKQCEGSPGFCTKCFCLVHS
ncbi:piggyBac transposable element-derived protein 4 [Papilio machaon]|uniref:piggyBac transposable element-derived protein 4 n=1 Tax=Papilio machaon TaxID=76193 RepID=UPI001E664634|nr:piggyBac transposable element-derived protein 4 [Papilio machaon]